MADTETFSLMEFQRKFNNEKTCEDYLFNMRWPNGYSCPKCNHKGHSYISTRKLYQCTLCKHQASVTAGTVMHRTRTSLLIWFWMIYLIVRDKRGHSALDISKQLGISYWKAWTNMQKIRNAMSERDANYQLCGLVEIDDAYFGSSDNSGKRGRGTSKAKVIVAVSKSADGKPAFAKIHVADSLNEDNVHDFVSQKIIKNSSVETDGLNIYSKLEDKGYSHKFQTTSEVADPSDLLPWAHTVISNAKAFIEGTYHGLKHKHLQAYLDEFCYRFNRRFWENQLFGRLINACIDTKAITFAELTQ